MLTRNTIIISEILMQIPQQNLIVSFLVDLSTNILLAARSQGAMSEFSKVELSPNYNDATQV